MSLTSFALRLVLSRLLKGQTWAGDRIYNSPINPIAEWENRDDTDKPAPYIAIYTGNREAQISGNATQGSFAKVDLIANIFLPPKAIIVEDGLELTTNNTGGAMILDVVSRQIDAALKFGPVAWRDVWDVFVISVEGIRARPLLYQIEDSVQVPCIELTYMLKTIPDPNFGAALLPGWQKLITAMTADPDYASFAPTLEALIVSPADLPDWRKAQADMGWSEAAVVASGLAPADPTDEDEPALVGDIELVEEF